jgi:hypothetical protein
LGDASLLASTLFVHCCGDGEERVSEFWMKQSEAWLSALKMLQSASKARL